MAKALLLIVCESHEVSSDLTKTNHTKSITMHSRPISHKKLSYLITLRKVTVFENNPKSLVLEHDFQIPFQFF